MKVLITDHRFPDIEQETQKVKEAGGTLVVAQVTDEDALVRACGDANGILTARAAMTKRVIDALERCRIIVRYGIGIDNIDVAAATNRGIMVANVPDYCIDEVSDHALAFILMLSRQMMAGISLARKDRWVLSEMPTTYRLRVQTCGIVGFGQIGSLLAKKVVALGMRALVYDPYATDARFHEAGPERAAFDMLLAQSDFISIHAPLNADTHHLFGKREFPQMKSTAFIINTSRGGLIDEAALLAALDSGQIAGAGLDVLESEAAPTPIRAALVNHTKAIVTAHTGWLSKESRMTLQARAVEQVIAALNGEVPYGLVNRSVAKKRVD